MTTLLNNLEDFVSSKTKQKYWASSFSWHFIVWWKIGRLFWHNKQIPSKSVLHYWCFHSKKRTWFLDVRNLKLKPSKSLEKSWRASNLSNPSEPSSLIELNEKIAFLLTRNVWAELDRVTHTQSGKLCSTDQNQFSICRAIVENIVCFVHTHTHTYSARVVKSYGYWKRLELFFMEVKKKIARWSAPAVGPS